MSLADIEFKEILKYAYTLYRKRCVGVHRIELYAQFAEDFVNSKRYVNCHNEAICLNVHNVNYHRIIRLFMHNGILVRKYFDKDTFTDVDCDKLVVEFFMYDNTITADTPSNQDDKKPIPTFKSCFTPAQIRCITDTANSLGIFKSIVSEDDMSALLNCTLDHKLQSANNRMLAVFFDELSKEKLICRNWQNVLSIREYILSSKSDKPLKRANLSIALSDETSKTMTDPNVYTIRSMTREVARMRENDDKMS